MRTALSLLAAAQSELDKFRSGRVKFWRCHQCPPRHDVPSSAAAEAAAGLDGREVEFPEVRCYGKHLSVALRAADAPPWVSLAEGATEFTTTVNEEDTRGFVSGTVWTVGQPVEVRVRHPTSGVLSGWRTGRVGRVSRCGHRMGSVTPWSSRKVDCFVLLLTRVLAQTGCSCCWHLQHLAPSARVPTHGAPLHPHELSSRPHTWRTPPPP